MNELIFIFPLLSMAYIFGQLRAYCHRENYAVARSTLIPWYNGIHHGYHNFATTRTKNNKTFFASRKARRDSRALGHGWQSFDHDRDT